MIRTATKKASLAALCLAAVTLWVVADIVPGDQFIVTAFAGITSGAALLGLIFWKRW